MVRAMSVIVAVVVASGCSQRVAGTPPAQINTPAEAEQAIDYLASAVENNDRQAGLLVFSERYGTASVEMAALLSESTDAAAWLRSRVLASETPDYYVFDLAAVGDMQAHSIRVHKQSSATDGVKDEGIEL